MKKKERQECSFTPNLSNSLILLMSMKMEISNSPIIHERRKMTQPIWKTASVSIQLNRCLRFTQQREEEIFVCTKFMHE